MSRLVLAVCAVVGLLCTGLVAHATTLTLDAGVLQGMHVAQSPQFHDLTVVQRVYSGQSGNFHHARSHGPYRLPAGSSYDLAWTTDRTIDCPSGTPDPHGLGGPFPATAGVHYVCTSPPGHPHLGDPVVTVFGQGVEAGE